MSVKRSVAAFLLATTTACTATRRVAPAEYVPENRPDRIVVLDDIGALHLLEAPTIVGENLVGVEAGQTVSLPVSQVTDAVVKVKSPGRTRLLVGGLTAATAGAIIGIVLAGSGANCQIVDPAGVPQEGESRAGDFNKPTGC